MTEQLVEAALKIFMDPAARTMFLVFVAAAGVGHVAVAVRAWLTGETNCIADRFRNDPKATVLSGLSSMGAIIVWGLVDGGSFATMSIYKAISTGIAQGAAIDALLNKSTRKVWTPEERAAAAAAKAVQPQPAKGAA